MSTGRYLWRLIASSPRAYLANILLWIGMELGLLLPGSLIKLFFDKLNGAAPVTLGIYAIAALFTAQAVARWAFSYAAFGGATYTARYFGGLLRRNLLARVLERPGAAALPETPGESLNRFRDDVDEAVTMTDWFLDLGGFFVFMAAALVVLLRISVPLTVVVLLPMVGVVLLTRAAGNRVEANRRQAREATAKVTGLLTELFGAVQAIQVARAEERATCHFERLSDRRRTLMLKDRLLTQLLDAINGYTVSLGTGLILLLSAQAIEGGRFTIGEFAVFVYYMEFFASRTHLIGMAMTSYRQTGVSFERLHALMQGAPAERLVEHQPVYLFKEPPSPQGPPVLPEAGRLQALTVTDLACHYPGSERGVRGVSLRIPRGSFTVIAGRVGSGKSTLVRALTGLLPLESGEIRWNGERVEAPDRFFTPPRCAATPQIPSLFSDTLRANILLGLPEEQAVLEGALRAAVLERDVAAMPEGLETLVGSRGVRLSGGQVQRTAAARMFVREPELLVLDDLSSALDVETEQLLWERVFARPGATCVAVSHRRAALRRADQILVLKDGMAHDLGTLEELLERCEEMRCLWQSDAPDGVPAAS